MTIKAAIRRRCVRLVTATCLVALMLSGCGTSVLSYSLHVSYDTAALRALKASAHMQTCPTTTAPPTGDLPKATLPCLGGGPSVALASLRGPIVINVWEETCGPCRTEMPYIQAFARQYAGRVAVLGVDLVDTQPAQALGFAKSVGVTYPMVADLNEVIRTPATPMTIFLDANGKITYQQPIAFTNEAQLQQLVQQHFGIKP